MDMELAFVEYLKKAWIGSRVPFFNHLQLPTGQQRIIIVKKPSTTSLVPLQMQFEVATHCCQSPHFQK